MKVFAAARSQPCETKETVVVQAGLIIIAPANPIYRKSFKNKDTTCFYNRTILNAIKPDV